MNYNKQCNRCGKCCKSHPCCIAISFFGFSSPCIALEFNNGEYSCGLINHAHKYISEVKKDNNDIIKFIFMRILGIGYGCNRSPKDDYVLKQLKFLRGDMACQENNIVELYGNGEKNERNF